MGKGIKAVCMLSGAFVNGFFGTAPWASPVLAAIGLTQDGMELFGSGKGLSKEFQNAVQAALKKTEKHFQSPEYSIRSLNDLFREVESPKNLNDLLTQMAQEKNRFSDSDTEEVVKFFELALQVEIANYPALASYYLLIGDRLNRDKLEKLMELEEENNRVAHEILGDIQLLDEIAQSNSEGIRSLLKQSKKAEKGWQMFGHFAQFCLDRLINATFIFGAFLFVCLIFDNQHTADNFKIIWGLVVLSDVLEYFYYQKYNRRIMNAVNANYDKLLHSCRTEETNNQVCRSENFVWKKKSRIFRYAHMRSTAVEALIQWLLLAAMVLVMHQVVSGFEGESVFWTLGGITAGVVAKHLIRTIHITVTPAARLESELSLRLTSDEDNELK